MRLLAYETCMVPKPGKRAEFDIFSDNCKLGSANPLVCPAMLKGGRHAVFSCFQLVKHQHKTALKSLTGSLNPPIELGTDMTALNCSLLVTLSISI